MRHFNLAVVEGRLTNDPELRYLQNGTALCKFSIANNQSYYKDENLQEEVNFIDITTWAKLAEKCNEYLKKGRRVLINGRLKQDKWQDNNGANRSKISIVGNQVQFLDQKKETEEKNAADPSDDTVPF